MLSFYLTDPSRLLKDLANMEELYSINPKGLKSVLVVPDEHSAGARVFLTFNVPTEKQA